MGAKSRNKGASGERELARLLREHLGDSVTRNWQGQAAKGGHDLDGLPFALEVKRYVTVTDALKRKWWEQAVIQSSGTNPHSTTPSLPPAMAYRADRQPWRIVVPLYVIEDSCGGMFGDIYEYAADVSVEAFCQLCREQMKGAA